MSDKNPLTRVSARAVLQKQLEQAIVDFNMKVSPDKRVDLNGVDEIRIQTMHGVFTYKPGELQKGAKP